MACVLTELHKNFQMRAPHAVQPRPENDSESPLPGSPRSDWYNPIISCCILFAGPTILGLLMVVFLAIPALMPPAFRLKLDSSLSSLNISTTHITAPWNIALSVQNPSKLISVKYTHMKLCLNFDGQLALSRPSPIPAFTQGPGNVATIRAEALSALAIVNDLGVKGLVSMLKGRVVSIDVVAKSKRWLHLGPRWVAVLDVHISCVGVIFTAPADSEGGGRWMILRGTQDCKPDVITILW